MPDARAIAETYSLLVLNVNFRTTSDDLFPLFSKYGKVIDIHIPRDRRTGESRGFAFVRYMYKDEAQKALDRLDGRVVDGREISVQLAKYGPHAERIHEGRILEKVSRDPGRSRSRSPRRRYRDDYHEDTDYGRRKRTRSFRGYEHDRYDERGQNSWYRSRSYSASPDYDKGRGRSRYDDGRQSRHKSFERASPYRILSTRWARSPANGTPMGHGLGAQNFYKPVLAAPYKVVFKILLAPCFKLFVLLDTVLINAFEIGLIFTLVSLLLSFCRSDLQCMQEEAIKSHLSLLYSGFIEHQSGCMF